MKNASSPVKCAHTCQVTKYASLLSLHFTTATVTHGDTRQLYVAHLCQSATWVVDHGEMQRGVILLSARELTVTPLSARFRSNQPIRVACAAAYKPHLLPSLSAHCPRYPVSHWPELHHWSTATVKMAARVRYSFIYSKRIKHQCFHAANDGNKYSKCAKCRASFTFEAVLVPLAPECHRGCRI